LISPNHPAADPVLLNLQDTAGEQRDIPRPVVLAVSADPLGAKANRRYHQEKGPKALFVVGRMCRRFFSRTLNPAMFGRAAGLVNVAGGRCLSARIIRNRPANAGFSGRRASEEGRPLGARATTGKAEPDWSVRRISRHSAGWGKMACG